MTTSSQQRLQARASVAFASGTLIRPLYREGMGLFEGIAYAPFVVSPLNGESVIVTDAVGIVLGRACHNPMVMDERGKVRCPDCLEFPCQIVLAFFSLSSGLTIFGRTNAKWFRAVLS